MNWKSNGKKKTCNSQRQILPYGPGTYGKKRGRPKKKKNGGKIPGDIDPRVLSKGTGHHQVKSSDDDIPGNCMGGYDETGECIELA